MDNIKILSLIEEINIYIQKYIKNEILRSAVKEYLSIEVDGIGFLHYSNQKILSERIGWLFFVVQIRDKKISDFNWDLICYLHNKDINQIIYESHSEKMIAITVVNRKNYDNHVPGLLRFHNILNKFYVFLISNEKYHSYKNIKEIERYKDLLITIHQSPKEHIFRNKDYYETYKTIISNFPIDSSYKNFIQGEYLIKENRIAKANYNINTENIFIKYIIQKFIFSYKRDGVVINPIHKVFYYYFQESVGITILNNIKCFNEQIFDKQYEFYNQLDLKMNCYSKITFTYNLKQLLLAFYRFICVESKIEYNIEPFSKQFKEAIFYKSFYKYYQDGFKFIFYNINEEIPKQDKICILPSINTQKNAYSHNNILLSFNLCDVEENYRSDIKDFLWYDTGQFYGKVKFIKYIKEFLLLSVKFKNKITNMNKYEKKEFSEEFLIYYRQYVEKKAISTSHLRDMLKGIRKFLKYFNYKYGVTQRDIQILNLTYLSNYKGGHPITEKDCALIYKEFEYEEQKDSNRRIYTIVFEIFMSSNLRIGTILNLKRECINERKNSIKYYLKTGKKQIIEEVVSEKIIILIKEAITLTSKYVADGDIMSSFIFINPQYARHNYKNRRISFYHAFKIIVGKISEKLDYDDYTAYNIRHTFINNVYTEGRKLGLTIVELSKITNQHYKTAKANYLDYNKIDMYVEALSKVVITNVDLYGNILEEEDNHENRNIVKNNLGKCNQSKCVMEIAECLQCNHFCTFINRIPVFEKRILECNELICKATNDIEIFEYNFEKKLLAVFLSKMLKIADEKGVIINES